MPSPFPGMDPYLEEHWRDIHASLIIYARDALQEVLPGSLRARVEERVLLETPTGRADHSLYPDVRVVEYPPRSQGGAESQTAGGVAVAEPLLIDTSEPASETFLEIIDRSSGNRIVTIIEFLSPSNKIQGPDREQYLRKQREVRDSDTNLVEIDLNRYGVHSLAFELSQLKPEFRTPYMTCVRRATCRYRAEVYPMPLWERLPAIKIPLRGDDADVRLDLQALIDQCYRKGGYEGTLDYTSEPDPPLAGADSVWAAERLREQGLRRKPPSRKAKRPSKKKKS